MAPPTIPPEQPVNDFANDVASQMEGFTQSQDIAEEAIARFGYSQAIFHDKLLSPAFLR